MIDAKITRGWDADDLRHADVDWGDEIEPPRKRKPWTPLDFPPQLRWGVRRGASIAERPKGTNGKRLCGWCDHDLPKYRRSWCSDQCAEKFQRVWSWGALREYIIGRDVVCQRCGSDWAGWLRTKPTGMYSRDPRDRNQCLLERAPWQVDHIFPVKDGGTDDPENLRLLLQWLPHRGGLRTTWSSSETAQLSERTAVPGRARRRDVSPRGSRSRLSPARFPLLPRGSAPMGGLR